ncbi:MAG: hypothetical protein UX09_C0002G0022 [Candidatus Uhrbacteria bacterium GW2011_GWE2_45_35]|uniref:Uncharacterized protein n=2 Tax=Candidatus Uhriibacteriota TaxID=1752732 RepID=A0A0G1LSZ3_9BACT|nr:MAG: hypothetical protein UW63_C0004G0003 [Candidatus Uhrbacteria bacterium GW2011_GWF2_44_350]KKU09179.1 MAG: hypothetical protein UX09_C0002G0022 [Candidatus Uhrbacteria bacterium GW2011_GWE2_45_35]HBR80110.1 hypothetical protein [Candidatus Uhrbacteria bacterium]HCU31212.1 hypothetical protein [Candidatus Uhrbacteria bacterium]
MFFKKSEKFHPAEIIARTLFLTSLISFAIFLSLDLLRPGFVSRSFSVFVFLFAALVSGFWWGCLAKAKEEKTWPAWLAASIFGFLGVYLTWQFRVDLGDFLVLIIPLALITPFLVKYLISNK